MNIIDELDLQINKINENTQSIIQYLSEKGYKYLADRLQGNSSHLLFPLDIHSLKELRMAAIMDSFTLVGYQPECQLLELTPGNWKNEMEGFKPHLLFIESAWKGKDDLWYRKISHGSKELYELTNYCHSENIPVIFWCKEDPVHLTTFMKAASLADVVFTTDIDCVQKYKTALGHEQVYHLHFAAQPAIHNPIEKYNRKDKFCFAGSYYHKYQHRAQVFDSFSEIFIQTKGFDIYDRNYKNPIQEYKFPERYNPYILGNLPANKIDVAYKGYRYGVNMNSIQQSQSMFARRVFEMLASNTITVGNYSRGVKNYFGDLTICTDDPHTMEVCLNTYCKDDITAKKYRLAGLRAVLSHHLYEDRLDYIVQKVFGKSLKRPLPTIAMVARCKDLEQVEHAVKSFRRQNYANKKLYILDQTADSTESDIFFLSYDDAVQQTAAAGKNDFYTCVSSEDYYGANYLLDLALTCRYGAYVGIGKPESPERSYQPADTLLSRSSIISSSLAKSSTLWEMGDPQKTYSGGRLFAIDEFNYCSGCTEDSCPAADDLVISDTGIPLKQIKDISEQIRPEETVLASEKKISGADLASGMKSTKSVSYAADGQDLTISSSLADTVHEYAYAPEFYSLDAFTENGKMQICFHAAGFLNCICVCVFYDADKTKLDVQYPMSNAVTELAVPPKATFFRVGFRPKGVGTFIVHDITYGAEIHSRNIPDCFLSRSGVLVLNNEYPSCSRLYSHVFVHKRMVGYKASGYVFDVMRMKSNAENGYREFEGINVVEGGQEMLSAILDSGQIHTVCVHFLDAYMWNILKKYTDRLKILVWCHGSDIHPWWRRTFQYKNETELNHGKKASEKRMELWTDIFSHLEAYPDLHFVFVSQSFANEIFEDYKINLPKERYSIIHNCIDTAMFDYVPKQPEQRLKILSIRPYSSNQYANDLSIKCIQNLSSKPYFSEFSFTLIGDGELFDEITKPLKKYKNVTCIKKFLRQDEIAELHKQYGLFLVPTRWDSQGVSRDEAMSSGLVPITNAVAAIPEFTNETCAILAPGEDYAAMAEGIDRLYHSPELFQQMSANAAARVRRQSSKEFTVDKELELICGSKKEIR